MFVFVLVKAVNELTLDFEGVDLQHGGVSGVLTGVVAHVVHAHLAEEQGSIIQHLVNTNNYVSTEHCISFF